MDSLGKRAQGALLALVLGLGCSFGAAQTRGQDSSPAASHAASKSASDAAFLAAADEVLQEMSEITGLKLITPLKKSLRSREEIRAYVIKQMNEEKNPAASSSAIAIPLTRRTLEFPSDRGFIF